MSYVLKSSGRPKGSIPSPIKILAGAVIMLFFLNIFLPAALPSFFTQIVRPFWGAGNDAALKAELQREFLETSSSFSRTTAVLQENEVLKDLFNRSTVFNPLLATILKRPPFSAYDTFILDVGDESGVKIGNRVYALGNIPIGDIAEVVGNTSRVRLYSSSGEKFTILIGEASIEALATGKGGGHFEASMPRETKIMAGDQVYIPSLSDAFVGTVEGIVSDPSEPFLKVLFRQPVNMYELRWVVVDTSSTPGADI